MYGTIERMELTQTINKQYIYVQKSYIAVMQSVTRAPQTPGPLPKGPGRELLRGAVGGVFSDIHTAAPGFFKKKQRYHLVAFTRFGSLTQ